MLITKVFTQLEDVLRHSTEAAWARLWAKDPAGAEAVASNCVVALALDGAMVGNQSQVINCVGVAYLEIKLVVSS